LKIRLKFAQEHSPSANLGELVRMMQSATSAHPAQSVVPTSATAAPAAAAKEAEEENLHPVKSPIVGTFYGSPSPGAAPFVSVGDTVEKGQVICIVEAMKLMNEIESDASGVIVKCLVSNGQPIEFGQPLFTIRTA
jgi:acetyl-CoA carboxylase biotin carboxyl carrier protein